MSYTDLSQLYDNLIDAVNDLRPYAEDESFLPKVVNSMKSSGYDEELIKLAETFFEKSQLFETSGGDINLEDFENLLLEMTDYDTDAPSSTQAINDTASISFVSEDAGYSNALLTYDVNEDGEMTNFRLLIEDTNNQKPGSLGEVSMHDGSPNLLLLSNGASQISADSVVEYKDSELYIDGKVYQGQGFFSHDSQVNIGHTPDAGSPGQFIIDEKTGEIRIEDICTEDSRCDNDYNDLVLKFDEPLAPIKEECLHSPEPIHPGCETPQTPKAPEVTGDTPDSRARDFVEFAPADFERLDATIQPIEDMANDMAAVANEANAEFKTAVANIDAGSFSELIQAQAGAANLTATVSASTGALQAVNSAASTTAGKIGS